MWLSEIEAATVSKRDDPCQNGDDSTEKFGGIIAEHYPSVLRFMRHLTRTVEDAEDLTQQAFIKARDNFASFRGEASVRTWLHRIAFHEYTHWKRKHRPWYRLSLDHVEPKDGYRPCIEGAALIDALHRLPAAMRETFLLLEVQQLSVEEIAGITGVPKGTVKSRAHHARLKLRTLLTQQEEVNYGTTTCEQN